MKNQYNHQAIDVGSAHEKTYFHISAPDFSKDLAIGFSNGYTDHNDLKWEIIAGGETGIEFVIRQGIYSPILARRRYADRTKWEEVRDSFAIQVRDGNIAIYSANPDGTKKDLIVEWDDETIVKAELNTLTVTGGFGGRGTARIRGVCPSPTDEGN